MRRNKGFTLMELQMSAVLMVVILIATGIIFYFSLAAIRYLHDASVVYANATNAMKAITDEVMRSNCYGHTLGPLYVPRRIVSMVWGGMCSPEAQAVRLVMTMLICLQ